MPQLKQPTFGVTLQEQTRPLVDQSPSGSCLSKGIRAPVESTRPLVDQSPSGIHGYWRPDALSGINQLWIRGEMLESENLISGSNSVFVPLLEHSPKELKTHLLRVASTSTSEN